MLYNVLKKGQPSIISIAHKIKPEYTSLSKYTSIKVTEK